MFKNAKNIAIATMLSLGALAAVPATAEAGHRHNGGFGIELQFGESGHSHWRRDRHWRRHHDWRRHGFHRRCSTDRALHKASRMGVRHAHVRYADYKVIKIKGRSHGHRVSILFSRAPGCPVIGY